MSLENSDMQTGKSINAKRLSLMLDSLQDSSDGAYRGGGGLQAPPALTVESPESENISPGRYSMYSVGNRSSFVSSYSGVVQEGIPVSFISKTGRTGQHAGDSGYSIPTLPKLPSQEQVDSFIPADMKSVQSSSPVRRFNSSSSNPLPLNEKPASVMRYASLRSSSSVKGSLNLKSIIMDSPNPSEDTATGVPVININSESNHSPDEQDEEDDNDEDTSLPKIRITSRDRDTDVESVSSSVMETLITTVGRANSGKEPIRSESNTYNPPIPRRNSRRPRSKIFVPEAVQEAIKQESQKEKNITSPVESTPPTPSSNDSSLMPSITSYLQQKAKSLNIQHELSNPMNQVDIDTFSQIMDVTNGTLVGSEFAKLDMKTEEKRILEKLVDALTRLAADMIIDPKRYDEGLNRLDKATKDLEGFTTTI